MLTRNSMPSAVAVPAIVLPAAVTPRAVTLTMRILHFTSIEYIRIAWSAVTTIDRAWRRGGALCLLPLTSLAS